VLFREIDAKQCEHFAHSNAYQGCDYRRAMVLTEQLSAMGLHLQIRRSRISGRTAPLPVREALADRSSIGKVDYQFAALRFREWLRDQFGGLSGREVADLAPSSCTIQSSRLSPGLT
jgi:hypothetical protein